jgi:hypothetical protein
VFGIVCAFFRIEVDIKICRGGEYTVIENGNRAHVLKDMILNICSNYSSLPDVRELTEDEIEFFYSGLKQRLLKQQQGK